MSKTISIIREDFETNVDAIAGTKDDFNTYEARFEHYDPQNISGSVLNKFASTIKTLKNEMKRYGELLGKDIDAMNKVAEDFEYTDKYLIKKMREALRK
jgi:type VII secretion effector (TIGR04197 family)